MKKNNDNELKKNFDTWAIQSLLANAKDSENQVIAWKVVAGKKITTEVSFYIIRKQRKEIIIRGAGVEGKKSLVNLATGTKNINIYLPKDLVLFQSSVKHIEPNGDVRITIPDMIAQIDRRKHFRLFLNDSIDMQIVFNKENHGQITTNQQFSKKGFDISAGGLSFIASRLEYKFFKVGDIIDDIKLELGSVQIVLSAEIVNIFEVNPDSRNNLNYKANKICVKYQSLSQEDERAIDEFVFQYIPLDTAI